MLLVRLANVSVVLVLVLGVFSGSAKAQRPCPASGGVELPEPPRAAGSFSFSGHGFGHGVGMSQYGAQGAAKLGCSAAAILGAYYPGTALGAAPAPARVVVGLGRTRAPITVAAVRGLISWELCPVEPGPAGRGCEPLTVKQLAGRSWTVAARADGSYEIRDGGLRLWSGGAKTTTLRAVLSRTDAENRVLRLSTTGARYRWGLLTFHTVPSTATADPATLLVTVDVPSVERYLRGVAEVPAAWPIEALKAQAIAARSYALARIAQRGLQPACRCHLYPTDRDQAYRGFDREAADTAAGHRWVEAVEATSGRVLRYRGKVATTFFSSSHGGFSESSAFAFGIPAPYLKAVDDRRWDLASDNPHRSWSIAVTADALGAAAGVGRATGVTVLPPLGNGGRVGVPSRGYGGVRVDGTTGTATLSGEHLRRALNLRSTLYTVHAHTAATGAPKDQNAQRRDISYQPAASRSPPTACRAGPAPSAAPRSLRRICRQDPGCDPSGCGGGHHRPDQPRSTR